MRRRRAILLLGAVLLAPSCFRQVPIPVDYCALDGVRTGRLVRTEAVAAFDYHGTLLASRSCPELALFFDETPSLSDDPEYKAARRSWHRKRFCGPFVDGYRVVVIARVAPGPAGSRVRTLQVSDVLSYQEVLAPAEQTPANRPPCPPAAGTEDQPEDLR